MSTGPSLLFLLAIAGVLAVGFIAMLAVVVIVLTRGGQKPPAEEAPRAVPPVGPPGSLEDEARRLLAAGRKIEAIKVWRERTGVGLAEAKDAVEALDAGHAKAPPPPTGDWEAEVATLARGGRLIEAIRLYRERTGSDLKTSKEAVEAIRDGK